MARVLRMEIEECCPVDINAAQCPFHQEDCMFVLSYCTHKKCLRKGKDGEWRVKKLPKQPAPPPRWCPLPRKGKTR